MPPNGRDPPRRASHYKRDILYDVLSEDTARVYAEVILKNRLRLKDILQHYHAFF